MKSDRDFALYQIVFSSCALFASLSCYGQLPLTAEDIIGDKGVLRLDASLVYANSDQRGLQTGAPVIIQTGDSAFTTVPTQVSEFKGDVDIAIATIGLRYGLTAKAELYGRASYLDTNRRSTGQSGGHTDSRFSSAWLGLNYRISLDNDTPALIGFVEGALSEKLQQDNVSAKSWVFGVTSYRAIDPVVLSITGGYGWNTERDDGSISYDPGDFFWLEPSVSFAVNERVTLITGVQWLSRKADVVNGTKNGIRQSDTDFTLGFGYGVARGNSLYFSFKTNGRTGNNLRFNWLYTI